MNLNNPERTPDKYLVYMIVEETRVLLEEGIFEFGRCSCHRPKDNEEMMNPKAKKSGGNGLIYFQFYFIK